MAPAMILNAYAVLDFLLSATRLGLGLLVLGLGVAAWRAWSRRGPSPEGRKALEDRCYLLFLLAGLMLTLNVVSWPLLYLLLQSYVPEWPGVMCVYGVTRIGTGSLGPARFLPPLLTALQLAKPALVFLSGAWGVLYVLNRQTITAPLTGRVLGVLLAAALLGTFDAGAELTYLGIPKKEDLPNRGCCTVPFDASSDSPGVLAATALGAGEEHQVWFHFYAVNGGMVLALGAAVLAGRRRLTTAWLVPLSLAAVLSVAASAVFLVEVAAPRLLHLPYHRCPYDLIPKAPESLVAVALFLVGAYAVGWAGVAAWLGADPETRPLVPGIVHRLLRLALLGYLGSLVMMSVELALA
jgi:hypothetical protein